jgi:hypothetical protein
MNAKVIIKVTALFILTLEVYWVVFLQHEPHAMSVAGAIGSLFGVNSCHEHFNKGDEQ